jgi:hypothetical protein
MDVDTLTGRWSNPIALRKDLDSVLSRGWDHWTKQVGWEYNMLHKVTFRGLRSSYRCLSMKIPLLSQVGSKSTQVQLGLKTAENLAGLGWQCK